MMKSCNELNWSATKAHENDIAYSLETIMHPIAPHMLTVRSLLQEG